MKNMKNFFLITISFLFVLAAKAQVLELGPDAFPVPGYSAVVSIADTSTSINPGPSGAGQFWDFTQFNPVRQSEVSYISRNEVPFTLGLGFLDATAAIQFTAIDDTLFGLSLNDAYEFFELTDSTFENIGFSFLLNEIPIALNVERNPDDLLYRFPLKLGDEYESFSRAVLDVTIIGLYYQQDIERTNVVDAEGAVQTPYGTFPTLRVVSTIDRVDSVRLDTQEVNIPLPIQKEYKWLTESERIPVVEMTSLSLRDSMDAPEVITLVRYIDSLQTTTSLAGTLEDGGLNIYPNPASEQIWVENQLLSGEKMEIDILTMDGKKIFGTSSISQLISLNLTALPAGIYTVRIKKEGGTFMGKLSVTK